jgi:hypothetical protein
MGPISNSSLLKAPPFVGLRGPRVSRRSGAGKPLDVRIVQRELVAAVKSGRITAETGL